jgi:hypothetical protein
MAIVTRSGGLFGAAAGASASADARSQVFGVEIGARPAGSMSLTLLVTAATLSFFLGSRVGGDQALLARNTRFTVSVVGDGIVLNMAGVRAKMGPSLVLPMIGTDDWLLGPFALPQERMPSPLDGHLRHALLPLIWRDATGTVEAGRITLPGLANRPAEIGAPSLSVDPPSARRRAHSGSKVRASAVGANGPPLPLPEPRPKGLQALQDRVPEVAIPLPPGPRRNRVARVRLTKGADGRIGLTLPVAGMRALWAGRPDTIARKCRLARTAKDLVILPADDPAASEVQGVDLVLRIAKGDRWYGRTARIDMDGAGAIALAGPLAKDGSGFEAEVQPGRVLLRGAVGKAVMASEHPAAQRLARARRMFTDALIMVKAAREEGAADIDILDASGMALVSLPREAVAVRIRGDGFCLSGLVDG